MTFQRGMESSSKGKAIKYTLGQWLKLVRSVDEGHLSIDNNRVEANVVRYSIVETAKSSGLILYDYMTNCMKELAKAEPNIDTLLLWNFKHYQYCPVDSWGAYLCTLFLVGYFVVTLGHWSRYLSEFS